MPLELKHSILPEGLVGELSSSSGGVIHMEPHGSPHESSGILSPENVIPIDDSVQPDQPTSRNTTWIGRNKRKKRLRAENWRARATARSIAKGSNQRDWLETQGYRLPRRYQADRRPSWDVDSVIWPTTEDSLKPRRTLMDATRISDNTTVMRKRVWKRSGVMVLNLNKLFRDEEYTCDPASHCSSYTELVEVPGYDGLFVMVMPFLRPYHNPEFVAIHECLDFFQKLFEVRISILVN
ncbi:hypothetical protein M422DRAFT_259159 [Sphaerobolus stellatus SS14]|uniref:Uncharacterized protein n=1 Tax=Sphaerobolus stellatus (strain SS14) TaxID=990650 RepID=A0A0C9UTQ5_SPHS4|nr:hypothetical protein M422DRAFT_259159 [Sphaerobolus stellatus SS14]